MLGDPGNPVYVIGVDPGVSTGIFVLRNELRVGYWQGAPARALTALRLLLSEGPPTQEVNAHVELACERYLTTGQRGARTHQPTPNLVCGEVLTTCERFNVPLHWQSPADAKRLTSTQQLKDLGLYTTAREVDRPDANDVNDAARHAVLLLARRFAAVYEQLLESAR